MRDEVEDAVKFADESPKPVRPIPLPDFQRVMKPQDPKGLSCFCATVCLWAMRARSKDRRLRPAV